MTIPATAILFNIGRKWGDEGPVDETETVNQRGGDGDQGFVVLEGDAASVTVRGQAERDILKDRMPV